MKFANFVTILSIFYTVVDSCTTPYVGVTVQTGGDIALGTQQASEFFVPLFVDCNYDKVPPFFIAEALGASFPTPIALEIETSFRNADGTIFGGDDPISLNTFLQKYDGLGLQLLYNIVVCYATAQDGAHPFVPGVKTLSPPGAKVSAYFCKIELGRVAQVVGRSE